MSDNPAAEVRTLAGEIVLRLRDDIVSGTLKPGQRLRFEMLRESYGASYSTLREALTSLTSESLVVAEGQRGFRVAPVSIENLNDLTDTRVLIEREAVRLSILHGSDDWEDGIVSAFHRLEREERRNRREDPEGRQAWDRVHREFHDALARGCKSPTLLAIRANLFDLSHRYRRLAALARQAVKKPRDNSHEHRMMMEAALARESQVAQDLIERHVRETAQNVRLGIEGGTFDDASEPPVVPANQ